MLADPDARQHLLNAMSQPTASALQRREELARTGSVDLGPVRVDRAGPIGQVTLQNHAFLNSEDELSMRSRSVAHASFYS
jgi:thioesterase DpgC